MLGAGIRYVRTPEFNGNDYNFTGDTRWVKDVHGRDLLIFNGAWTVKWAQDKNEGLVLSEFHQDIEEG